MPGKRDSRGRFVKGAGRSQVVTDHSGMETLRRQLAAGRHTVRVGVFGGTAGAPGDMFTMAALLATHEYGSRDGHSPARRPVRRTLEEKRSELVAFMAQLAEQIVAGRLTIDRALEAIGQWVSAAIKRTITDGVGLSPPNAPATIDKKDSDRPLVDNGRLVPAITYQVEA